MLGEPAEFRRPPLIQHETALSTCLRPYPALGSYGIIPSVMQAR